MVKSRYIGDGHPTFNRNPYNAYINPYYWVDDHPLLYGNNGSWSTLAQMAKPFGSAMLRCYAIFGGALSCFDPSDPGGPILGGPKILRFQITVRQTTKFEYFKILR